MWKDQIDSREFLFFLFCFMWKMAWFVQICSFIDEGSMKAEFYEFYCCLIKFLTFLDNENKFYYICWYNYLVYLPKKSELSSKFSLKWNQKIKKTTNWPRNKSSESRWTVIYSHVPAKRPHQVLFPHKWQHPGEPWPFPNHNPAT